MNATTNRSASSLGPQWLSNAVFYQIYPQSYRDGNGDGIGDIVGIIESLDYIKQLGVGAIWLNPCFVSPFRDAGYDVADYRRVDPRYGTNDDLIELFRQAHRRDLRVCLDLVAGHTSTEHPWFVESCRPERNQYSDYYIWTDNAWDTGEGSGQSFVKGYADRDGAYAVNFFYSQPALNYGFYKPDPRYPWQQPVDAPGPQAVRAELKAIMQFWLEAGADGFRVDMANSLVKNDPQKQGTIALWQEFRQWLDRDHPHAVLVAEWGRPTEAITAGFHVDFMIHFNEPGYQSLFFDYDIFARTALPKPFFCADGAGDIAEFLGAYLRQYVRTVGRGYISIPSANHDFQRPRWRREPAELAGIFTFLFTWPGVPVLYYGDEIGMRFCADLPSKEGGFGRCGSRTPMQWDTTPNAGFSSAAADSLYLPIDTDPDRPCVAAQDRDPQSLLNHVRTLIALRATTPALAADGGLSLPVVEHTAAAPFVYERFQDDQRFLVVVNPLRRAAAVAFPSHRCAFAAARAVLCNGVGVERRGAVLQVQAQGFGYAIFELTDV